MDTLADLMRFYEIIEERLKRVGGTCLLGQNDWKKKIPNRGVYYFFELGEERTGSGTGLRVVRVGTHGLGMRGNQGLGKRLAAHRGKIGGKYAGGGNHRKSIFRHHVGMAIITKTNCSKPSLEDWKSDNNIQKDVEHPIEIKVSQHIRNQMPFSWFEVNDIPGIEDSRGYIEANSIALLSNHFKPFDPPSKMWLGLWHPDNVIKASGLWNKNHTNEEYDPDFLDILEKLL